MSHPGRVSKFITVAACIGLGCTGNIASRPGEEDPGKGSVTGPKDKPTPGTGGKSGGDPMTGTGGTMAPPAVPGEPGVATFRRLSHLEYNNTVHDLLGDTTAPATTFPPDLDLAKSGYVGGGVVANADAAHLFDAASALATAAAGDPARLAMLLPCGSVPAAAADQDACAAKFITQFGKRAFRRPLTAEETADFTAYYTSQHAAPADFTNAVRLLIAGFLLSPQFLYHWEATADSIIRDGNLVRYNSYEIASRLSYLFWASMPDQTAFAKADKGELSTPDQIAAEATRLLMDPGKRSKAAVADFFTQWLSVADMRSAPKDPKAFPAFTPELADSMGAETAAFAANAVIEGDGKLSTIFTSTTSFIDANLAKLYGVTGVTATTPTSTNLAAAHRAGILTQASFLTQHANSDETNPARRGKILADRVICADIQPPPDVVPDPDPPMQGVSVRQRFAKHSKNPCANACHGVIDPLGFAFESYNGIGAYQTMDLGAPVDTTGKLELDGKEQAFKDAIDLQAQFGQSPQVANCMAKQFLRYTLRRHEDICDEESLMAAQAAFAKQSNNLRDLMVALTRTRAFTHRTPAIGEVLP